MNCPDCGSDKITPLTLQQFDNLRGAAKVCDSCLTAFLIVQGASVPEPLRKEAIAQWHHIQTAIYETLDQIRCHPVINDFLYREGVESEVWYRDAGTVLERLVSQLIPDLRIRGGTLFVGVVVRDGLLSHAFVASTREEAVKDARICGTEHFNAETDEISVFEIGQDGSCAGKVYDYGQEKEEAQNG